MKNMYKLLIALVIMAGLNSCSDDYLNVNSSPNDPTSDNLNPSLTLAGALSRPAITYFTTGVTLGGLMTNQWGGDINNFAVPFSDEFRLNVTTSFYNTLWDNTFLRLNTTQAVINYEGGGYEDHQAIARINKVFYFQGLVDLYGDVPYTEALQQGGDLTPSYADAKTIYRDLIVQLDMAIAQLSDGEDVDNPVGPEDIAFQGDISKWVKVANTLKLRILLRQATLAETDGATQTYLNEQFAALDNNFLTEDFTFNPGYINATDKQNPFFGNFGLDASGIQTRQGQVTVASNYFAEFLKGTSTENGVSTGVLDPRAERLFALVGGEVLGVVQGDVNDNTPDELSHLGPGLLKGSNQDLFVISAAESYFLQSEAAFRTYIGGNAKNLFQQGITASFANLDVEAAAAAYITASDNSNRIGWDGSANKIEAIITQKWIALNGRNGIEAFVEFNRTGFPAVPLSLIAEKPNKPYRLLYPASEYTANSANVPTQTTNDAFTKKIFWDAN